VFSQLAGTTQIGGIFRFLGMDIGQAFDAAEREGLISILAEPTLTALSGETAEFLAGGEFPIPLARASARRRSNTRISASACRTRRRCWPTVRISIRVRPEVSELSNQGAVTVNSYTVPALTVRRAETTVELGSGQSFMIAGLLKNDAQTSINKLPGAGDVPILGSLFRSTEFQKGQTELVIVVTPYLVRPVNHDSDIALPTDGFRTPTALDQFLGNIDNEGESGARRPAPTAEGRGHRAADRCRQPARARARGRQSPATR
jgi:pilus assembly protein CpaC